MASIQKSRENSSSVPMEPQVAPQMREEKVLQEVNVFLDNTKLTVKHVPVRREQYIRKGARLANERIEYYRREMRHNPNLTQEEIRLIATLEIATSRAEELDWANHDDTEKRLQALCDTASQTIAYYRPLVEKPLS